MWQCGNVLALDSTTLLENHPVIRRQGPHAGRRIYFGYDRYVTTELEAYRSLLESFGPLVETVEAERLHYLTSAERTCRAIQSDDNSFGILCCGTGMGMSIAANKFAGVYAARCTSLDDAELCRTINNANVLCIAAKAGFETNREIITTFVMTAYTGRKLDELEYITQFEQQVVPPLVAAKSARLRRTA